MDEDKMREKIIEHDTELRELKRQCATCFSQFLPGLEARLRSVETRLAIGFGIVTTLQIVVPLLIAHFLKAKT